MAIFIKQRGIGIKLVAIIASFFAKVAGNFNYDKDAIIFPYLKFTQAI
jgi:hypothetical protein